MQDYLVVWANILKVGQQDKSSESGIVLPKAGQLECLYIAGNCISNQVCPIH